MLAMLIVGTIIAVTGIIAIIVVVAEPHRMRIQDKKTLVKILYIGGFLVVLGIILSAISTAIK